ncbi:MAG: site-specific integrase, partial [Oscillospiraceae bacterium]|nr:site-specific integrase [Oscillospiraceae bacterium]
MGKNLRGKELGRGLVQRKDGLYMARYTDQLGVRKQKYFHTLPEARNWLQQAKETPLPQDGFFISTDMTVDSWFEFWLNHLVSDLAPNTLRNYNERYKQNIQPVIGSI